MTTIHELFERQVGLTPDTVAAEFKDSRLTYRELDRRADLVAAQLSAAGVGSGSLVALFLERSLDLVVAMLGVLKAGAAYIPLDPTHPHKRLAYMLADARPVILLTQARLQPHLPPHAAQVVVIDADTPDAPLLKRDHACGGTQGACELAYVIYTSGSTGEPKGVEIEHHAVVNLLTSMLRRPGLAATDRMLAITTVAFDIAVLEIFLPLICGACSVIAAGETIRDGESLARLIERSDVNVIQATPATLRMLLDAGWTGAPDLKILCGGEAWTSELASRLLSRCGSLWNMYGPTETTVWSAVAKVEAERSIVIGRPVANTRLYVLDAALQLVPVGVPGELYIGGQGLARGYLHRPQLTNERFVSDPFAQNSAARMYRTGDLVRRLPDGNLEFLGRLDNQVKIRGHRIELGEIEAALERHPTIQQSAVVARADAHGDRSLIAYILPTAGCVITPGELRLLLGETLPVYMIPTRFVSVAAFPLTPNGKLDRNALPPPDAPPQGSDANRLEPSTPTERVLARIWCNMLELEQVSVRDNFFEMGGHSLLAVRVIAEINKTLKVRLHVPAFFLNPTIERLARVLEQNENVGVEPKVVPLQPGHSGPPLYFVGAGPVEYQLAQLIGNDRAIFAIDAPMPAAWRRAISAGDRAALPSIEQLGTLHSDALLAHAGSKPCVVLGYSFFGKIAFEAARALQNAGGRVAVVILIDARASTSTGTILGAGWQSLQWIWRAASVRAHDTRYFSRLLGSLANSWRLLLWFLARMPELIKNHLQSRQRVSGHLDNEGAPIDPQLIYRWTRIAAGSWRPRPLDAEGVLLRGKFPGEEKLPAYDFTNGWDDLFMRGLDFIQAAGDHVSMVGENNVGKLARQIDAVVERYGRDAASEPQPLTRAVTETGGARALQRV